LGVIFVLSCFDHIIISIAHISMASSMFVQVVVVVVVVVVAVEAGGGGVVVVVV